MPLAQFVGQPDRECTSGIQSLSSAPVSMGVPLWHSMQLSETRDIIPLTDFPGPPNAFYRHSK